jgi:taurine dioxygenase
MSSKVEIIPLTPSLGAEIIGIEFAICPTYTTRIDGLSTQQSDQLLSDLFRHCTRPEFSCRFKWSPNCITLWDNRNTMHYAVNDYDGYRRCLYRTTILGKAPLAA